MVEMTIKNIKPKIQYLADGIETRFYFPFAVFKAENVTVYFDAEKQTSGYSVRINTDGRDGGFVVFDEAPSADTGITIVRRMVIERISDFQAGGAIRAEEMNYELDYRTACEQQLADDLSRSITLPPYVRDEGIDFSMPLPDAGKAIVWARDGKSLENSTVELNNVMGEIESARNQVVSSANEVEQQIQNVQAIQSELNAKVEVAESGIDTKYTEAVSGFDTVVERAKSDVEAKVADVCAGIDADVAQVKAYADEVNAKIATVDADIADVNTKLTEAQGAKNEITSMVNDVQSKCDACKYTLIRYEGRCTNLESRMDNLNADIDEFEEIQERVNENAQRVQEYVDTMDTVSGLRAGDMENADGKACDIDTYLRPATYVFLANGDGGGAITNVPFGQNGGVLQVFGNSNVVKQLWYPDVNVGTDSGVAKMYVRTGRGSGGNMTWDEWM